MRFALAWLLFCSTAVAEESPPADVAPKQNETEKAGATKSESVPEDQSDSDATSESEKQKPNNETKLSESEEKDDSVNISEQTGVDNDQVPPQDLAAPQERDQAKEEQTHPQDTVAPLEGVGPDIEIPPPPTSEPTRAYPPGPLSTQGFPETWRPTEDEKRELVELSATVRRFEREAALYRESAKNIVERAYKEKREFIFNSYERQILALEEEERRARHVAIDRFEKFLGTYPNRPGFTPDAMFRLSELYFERSYDHYLSQRKIFDAKLAQPDADSSDEELVEPTFDYSPTITLMKQLINAFPDYRLADGARYLLGYCLAEQGDEEKSIAEFRQLVKLHPNSHFAPEVWTRIGEYHFAGSELKEALEAYQHVADHKDSPFYDKALYKLAWTHYRLADAETAPDEFQAAVDTFVKLLEFNVATKEAGKERAAELRGESIQYVAISFAEEGWGGLDKLLRYLDNKGERPYTRELIIALGDVFFDQTRFQDAAQTYAAVQSRYPMDPNAPVVQEKLVNAFERHRDFDSASRARDALAKLYGVGSTWRAKNFRDGDALRMAEELTKSSVYSAAIFHHRQAQLHKEAGRIEPATGAYQKAAELYSRFLDRFPHDKRLYELRYYLAECEYYSLQFKKAARSYTWVRDAGNDTYKADAALSVVLAYENAIKQEAATGKSPAYEVLKSTERDADADLSPKPIPRLHRKLIGSADTLVRLFPKNENVPRLLYKAAEAYYIFDHYEEARKRFVNILHAYPENEVATFATNLIIETYLAQDNYREVERFARTMLEKQPDDNKNSKLRKELLKFKAGAMFKIAESSMKERQFEKAAEQYLALLKEHPDNEFADSALNNAAVAFEEVSRFDSASKLYLRLVKDYPDSPLAPNAVFRVGLNAERFFDFDKAIEAYSTVVKNYPESDRRADALYNTALALENTQQYEKAARQYLRYCEMFPEREDAPAVCFRAGVVYEKKSDPQRVVKTFNSFIKKYRNNDAHQDRIIEAYLKIAKTSADKGRDRDALKAYQRAVDVYNASQDEKSAPFAAEAQFQVVERDFDKFTRIKFEGPSKKQKKILTQKAEMLKEVEKSYNAILGFKQMEWTMASLFRIGQLYQTFAESMINGECPPDVKRTARKIGMSAQDVCNEYRILLEEKAFAIEDKAVTAFETTVKQAREKQVVNQWTKRTLVELNKLRRSEWPLQKEAKRFIDPVAFGSPPLLDAQGHGLRKDYTQDPNAPAEDAADAGDEEDEGDAEESDESEDGDEEGTVEEASAQEAGDTKDANDEAAKGDGTTTSQEPQTKERSKP